MVTEDFTYQLIVKHEGWKNRVYLDSRGNLTVGVGFNLRDPGAAAMITHVGADYFQVANGKAELNDAQVAILFNRSLITAANQAWIAVPRFALLPLKVQAVITDMCFNLGLTSFLEFKHFIGALGSVPPDYPAAAAALKDSLWFTQVGERAVEDYNLVLACTPNPVPEVESA